MPKQNWSRGESGVNPDALCISLIVIALALVCGSIIFRRRLKPDEGRSQVGRSAQSLDPVERALLEDLRRLE
jgi:hypothetical protein